MKTILYTFSTEAGTFWIRPEPADRVRLGIDNIELKTYSSPKAAARAVAERHTGWDVWIDRRLWHLRVWKGGSVAPGIKVVASMRTKRKLPGLRTLPTNISKATLNCVKRSNAIRTTSFVRRNGL